MMTSHELVINQTKNWLSSFIVALNICPFAKREIARNRLDIRVSNGETQASALQSVADELVFLDNNPLVETLLLVFPSSFKDFFSYLDFVDVAELLLQDLGYEGIYQLATFHPDYCFADTKFDDVANYTNRSPYPMLHILREDGLEKAIEAYGDTGQIFRNNIATLRALGADKIEEMMIFNKETG
jgi:hypothetical protein